MRSNLLINLFCLVLGVSSLNAQQLPPTIGVKCVQRNLELLGYNPRGVDGSIGPGTKAASVEFMGANEHLQLSDLTDETAESWCFKMIENYPDNLTLPVKILAQPDVFEVTNARIYGGSQGVVELAAYPISEKSSSPFSDGEFALSNRFPSSFVEQASYICVEGIASREVSLAVRSSSLDDPGKIDGLTNIHPYFIGYCRWSESGGVVNRNPDLFELAPSELILKLPLE